ncbi:DUF1616 domain-containing protein [Candidatus Pacearchaeota archaeon]|jgi:hypothetical protein|nr:DUF1616 domain-containing protein [Candidatus Pacearchaeota archaeon]
MKIPKLQFKGYIAEIINYLFQALLITYLILLLIEQVWSASVSLYFNLNYLLIVVIISGVLDVFSEHPEKKESKPRWWDYLFIGTLGILGLIIIKFKTGELGWLSWLISIIAGVLIILLSVLVLEDEDGKVNTIKKESHKHKPLFYFLLTLVIIFILNLVSISLTIFANLSYLESLRIIFGSIYVLFLPGFIISFIFFSKTKSFESEEKGSMDWIERIALSFALSIAVVPLSVFYLNLVGVKINMLNSFLTILGIIAISSGILYFKKKV